MKLHRPFAHPTAEKLIKLLREAGIKNNLLEDEVRKIDSSCETCMKFKRTPSRPVVCMPMARKFNEVVSMDLKAWEDKYFLVMVDMATRYCNACVINKKTPRIIVDAVMRHWIALFGAPRKFLTDNGGEFNNEEFRSMCENFNTVVMCTAAESPWSNGICERLNAVLKDNVLKVLEENKCNVETALSWAVSARNSLNNNHGFSPNQLVFSFNPNLPNTAEDRLPALENITSSQTVADNLVALRKSREEFIKADASERIRRGLSKNVRKTEDVDTEIGSYVYYKRDGEDRWRGPARVIGKDGKVNIVRHGGHVVRAHVCRIRGIEDVGEAPVLEREKQLILDSEKSREAYEGDDDEDCEKRVSVNEVNEQAENVIDGENYENQNGNIVMPKVGNRYEITLADTREKMNVRITGRAGKATGKYKDCYNFRNESSGKESWMDFGKNVSEIREVGDDEEVMITMSDEVVMEAKRKEIGNWIENEVFEEVEWEGQKLISVRWIITEKMKKDGMVVKARLVARGFEEENEDIIVESPTCGKEALRIALTVMLRMEWRCNTIDIKSAYLQGHRIERDVYLMPPQEFFSGRIWRLKKTVYGLKDAARAWYETVKEELLTLGMKRSKYIPAMFVFMLEDKLEGIVCIHVDDFCWGGSRKFEDCVVSKFKKDFMIGTAESGAFKYIGLNIRQLENGIIMDQESYIKSLHQVDICHRKGKRKDLSLNSEETHLYRSVVGQLNWIGTQTRPDISFDVCSLSMRFGKCTIGDLMEANKVINRVKTEQVSLFFPVLTGEIHLLCYSDASFANLSSCHSQGGFIIFLCDERGRRCPIMWKSRKIRRVVHSTLAAETLSLVEAAESAYYIREILEDIGIVKDVKVICMVDSKSLVDALKSMKDVDNKYLRISIASLKEMIDRKEITSVQWVDTKQQLANCLTKKGGSPVSLLEAITL